MTTQVKNADLILRYVQECDRITAPEVCDLLAKDGIAIEVRNVRQHLLKLEELGLLKSEPEDTKPGLHKRGSPRRRFYSLAR